MEQVNPIETRCMICGQQKVEGIFIISEFLCDACEAEIVNTEVDDERYPFFISQMRRIWLQKDA